MIVRKAALGLGVLFLLSAIVFALFRLLPGDPAVAVVGFQADPETIAQVRKNLGLDKPVYVQYYTYLKGILQGDLGYSHIGQFSVASTLIQRLRMTLPLLVSALVISVIGGVLSACFLVHLNLPRFHSAVGTLLTLVISVPQFVTALGIALVLGYRLSLFPVVYDGSLSAGVLPVTALSIYPYIWTTRIVSDGLRRTMTSPFIQFYRAMGFPESKLVFSIALPNISSLLPSIASNVAIALTIGSFFVEYIFNWPGIGQLTVFSIFRYDIPVIQAVTLITGLFLITVHVLTDIAYAYLNPEP